MPAVKNAPLFFSPYLFFLQFTPHEHCNNIKTWTKTRFLQLCDPIFSPVLQCSSLDEKHSKFSQIDTPAMKYILHRIMAELLLLLLILQIMELIFDIIAAFSYSCMYPVTGTPPKSRMISNSFKM